MKDMNLTTFELKNWLVWTALNPDQDEEHIDIIDIPLTSALVDKLLRDYQHLGLTYLKFTNFR